MRPATVAIKKIAIFCHRWMGVAFCLLFMWWFISGIFMMYWSYPEVSAADRLEHAPVLDAARVKLSPEEAAQAAGLASLNAVRLSSFDGRPAYFFRLGQGMTRGSAIVYADTGQQQDLFPPDLNLRTAAAWAGQPADSAKTETVTEPNQWTLGVRRQLPLQKYSFPGGQQVYLSEDTGEVVQYTTASSRIYAHLGAIPHWLYYTPLRINGKLWNRVVVWSSGIATLAATLGLLVGIWMWSPRMKYRHQGQPTSIPYTGQKRLHTILGLFFGILAMTWAFSGMLSMEPFEFADAKGIPFSLPKRQFELALYQGQHPQQVLARLGSGVKALEYTSFLNEPVFHAVDASGSTHVIPVNPAAILSADRVKQAAVEAAGENLASVDLLTKYDAYYIDRTGTRPLPVLRVQLKDAANTRLYIDPATARIAGRYSDSTSAWVNRWLYHGLHSFDFPWLYNNRPAWDIVVISLMLSCVWLSWTSMVLSYRVVKRKLGTTQARRMPNEDLPLAGQQNAS